MKFRFTRRAVKAALLDGERNELEAPEAADKKETDGEAGIQTRLQYEKDELDEG